jgi:hypothetical protein
MHKRFFATIILIPFLSLLSTQVLADTWYVTTPTHVWEWDQTGGAAPGTLYYSAHTISGQQGYGNLQVNISSTGVVSAVGQFLPQPISCTFTGQQNGNSASGTYVCTPQGQKNIILDENPWSATISVSSKK